jgi:hypothetical protein
MTTATAATNMTLAGAKKFAKAMTPVVNDLLTTRLIAERVKQQIDDECLRILSAGEYHYASKWYDMRVNDRLPEDRIVRIVRDSFLMADDDRARYFTLRADFIEQAGWQCERDYCPASMAESKCIRLEQQILDAMAEMMHCPAVRTTWGEHREKALELATGLVVSLATYRQPKIPTEWLGKAL